MEDILLLIIIMIGIAVKIYPAIFDKADSSPDLKKANIYDFLFLAYIPLGIALSNILLRKMKGLHFIQLSVYKIITALLISTCICLIEQTSLEPVYSFDAIDVTYLLLTSLI